MGGATEAAQSHHPTPLLGGPAVAGTLWASPRLALDACWTSCPSRMWAACIALSACRSALLLCVCSISLCV